MATDSTNVVLVERRDAIGIVTLNRPKRRNAFSLEMKERLIETFTELHADRSCRAIVLTGAGGVFCAGGDVNQMANESTNVEDRLRLERSAVLARHIATGPKPVIAAVEGFAFGAGLSFVAASDYVVAASNARLCAVFVKVGLHPDNGCMWFLQRRVGPAKAAELVLLGSEFDGNEAARIGVANAVVAPGQALDYAMQIAARFAELPPAALALIKASLATRCSSLEESLRSEVDLQPILMNTRDHAEAVAAFLEKRPAKFIGK